MHEAASCFHSKFGVSVWKTVNATAVDIITAKTKYCHKIVPVVRIYEIPFSMKIHLTLFILLRGCIQLQLTTL